MKIGVALGGGGVRGMAHVLALEAIDAAGVTPAALAGTSMGAIVGALYASGRSGKDIRELAERHVVSRDDGLKEILQKRANLIKWLAIVRPAWKGTGLLRADGFLHYLLDEIQVTAFEDLKIPLRVMATDYVRGDPVVLEAGELLPALRASMSIPGVFVPVEYEGRILVDGGVTNNLPYDQLPRDCDKTIAIDVAPTRDATVSEPPNAIEAVLGMFDILIDQATKRMMREKEPSIYVRPELVGVPILDFERIEQVWEQARPVMDELPAKLRTLLSTG